MKTKVAVAMSLVLAAVVVAVAVVVVVVVVVEGDGEKGRRYRDRKHSDAPRNFEPEAWASGGERRDNKDRCRIEGSRRREKKRAEPGAKGCAAMRCDGRCCCRNEA